MSTAVGPRPRFRFVETIDADELERRGGFSARNRPLLVKGAIKRWPAMQNWTFERLAALRRKDGSEVVTSFQNGLVEQGATRTPLIQPIEPYLLSLRDAAMNPVDDVGLLPRSRREKVKAGEAFELDWTHFQRFTADKPYLAQWDILGEFPALKKDFSIPSLWPGWRWTWQYTFIGPGDTVTGLHYDFPNNWFCMVSGTKEFMLFPPDQKPHMCKSLKYDWGATLSDVDVTRLDEQPREREQFARAEGLYARVESGDALFVPKQTWHSVVSLQPSVSLAVFGLTAGEILGEGGPSEFRSLLHKMHLYRWGNCTCHGKESKSMGRRETSSAPAGTAAHAPH